MDAITPPATATAPSKPGLWRRISMFFASRRRSFRFWVCVLLGVILLILVYYIFADRYTPLTTDAYLQSYVVQVAPQVEGQVVEVLVHEGSIVKKGDLLFALDPRPFANALGVEKAKLVEAEYTIRQLNARKAAAEAEHRQLEAEAEYAKEVHRQEVAIYKTQSTTERKYLDAIQKKKATEAAVERSKNNIQDVEESLAAKVGEEHAIVAQAKASLAQAELDAEYAKIYAPCDGTITNLQLRVGAYAHVGQAVLTVVDSSEWVVVANINERSLERMHVGDPALVGFQSAPGRLWPGKVVAMGAGVGQGQGIPSGVLPEVASRTSWIPEAQRFQVRVALDEPQSVVPRVGMTASVSVYIGGNGPLAWITCGLHRLVSWLYYL